MNPGTEKRIAAISMARNDAFFVDKWISYYGQALGEENLFLVLDGHDQEKPAGKVVPNVIALPRREQTRARGDRNRARLLSHLARSLFHRYDVVIAHDIDECLVLDPSLGTNLREYLGKVPRVASLSALGLDVGQHLKEEKAIDPSRPFLEQRSYAHVFHRYTKAVIAFRPLTWGSGFHRVKHRNFRIDPHLYLFHFGMVDYQQVAGKTGDQALLDAGWEGHLERRLELFELITRASPLDGDAFFPRARRRQQVFRPLYALNKPGKLKEKPIIRIPERFHSSV